MNKVLSTNRNINLDLLRSTIMFFIVIWHSIVHGLNIASNSNQIILDFVSETSIFNFWSTKLLMYATSIGVNCFILITGYFMIDYNKSIWPRFIKIWGKTSFYSLLFSFIFYICDSTEYGIGGVIFTAFPIYNGEYWFVSKYLALILLTPFLIKISKNITQKEYFIGIIILSIITINIPPILNYGNIYSGPNNLLFFINLFFIGGYISKFSHQFNSNKIGTLFYLLILLFPTYDLLHELYKNEHYQSITSLNINSSLSNNSITFILSLLFFLYFKNKKIKKNKISNFIANITPYTFAVYLIHDNDEIRIFLWKNLNLIQYYDSNSFIIILLGFSLLIFSVCIFIDYLRNKIFKLLHIENITNKILDKVDKK